MPRKKEDDLDEDDLVEQIIEKGKEVFSHDWDSGGPFAGADSEKVFRWKGKFAVCSDSSGNDGPFSTLEEALESQDLLQVTGATTCIVCTMLTPEELAKRLECDEEDGYRIGINGEAWVYKAKAGKFTRVVEDDHGDARNHPDA
jgi:hypothetical protein